MNVADLLDRAARHYPGEPALVFEGKPTSYAELREAVEMAAGKRTSCRETFEFVPSLPKSATGKVRPGAASVGAKRVLRVRRGVP